MLLTYEILRFEPWSTNSFQMATVHRGERVYTNHLDVGIKVPVGGAEEDVSDSSVDVGAGSGSGLDGTELTTM